MTVQGQATATPGRAPASFDKNLELAVAGRAQHREHRRAAQGVAGADAGRSDQAALSARRRIGKVTPIESTPDCASRRATGAQQLLF